MVEFAKNNGGTYPEMVEQWLIPSITVVIEHLAWKITNVIDLYNSESKDITKNYSQNN